MAEDPEAIEWYVTDGDSEPRGPLLPAQLRELHASGGLAGLHYFSSAGFSKWLPLEVVADALGIELTIEPPLVSPRRRGEPVEDELHSTADAAVWDLLFDSRDTQWVRSYAPSLMPALAAAVAAAREVGDVAAADPLLFVASQLLRQRAKQEWQRDSSPTKYRRAAEAAQPPKHASAAVEIVASLGVDAAVAPALFLSDEPRQTALTLTRVECTERLRLAGMEGLSATVWAGLSALQRASPSPAAKIGERPPTPPPPDERRGNDLSPLFDAVAADEAARAAVATAEIAAALPQRLQSADPAERRAALNAAANLDPALLADYAADVAACVGADDDLSSGSQRSTRWAACHATLSRRTRICWCGRWRTTTLAHATLRSTRCAASAPPRSRRWHRSCSCYCATQSPASARWRSSPSAARTQTPSPTTPTRSSTASATRTHTSASLRCTLWRRSRPPRSAHTPPTSCAWASRAPRAAAPPRACKRS